MKGLGQHLLIELAGCESHSLNDTAFVREAIVGAAQQGGATVIQTVMHQFNPQGVSGVVVIAESHITVHTWPEHGYAAGDVFSCSDKVDPYRIMELLVETFSAHKYQSAMVHRGGLLEPESPKAVEM